MQTKPWTIIPRSHDTAPPLAAASLTRASTGATVPPKGCPWGEIVCFLEAYLPGLRGMDFDVPSTRPTRNGPSGPSVSANMRSRQSSGWNGSPTRAGRSPPSSSMPRWVRVPDQEPDRPRGPVLRAGDTRRLFEINGVKFVVAICHEAFRYPRRSGGCGPRGQGRLHHPPRERPDRGSRRSGDRAVLEKAMMCRGLENTVYFCQCQLRVPLPESAISLSGPSGEVPGPPGLAGKTNYGGVHRCRVGDWAAGRPVRPRYANPAINTNCYRVIAVIRR